MVEQQFVVLGMHRSGTSIVANMLHRAGISMGTDFIKGKASNVDGHFEDKAMVAANERIFSLIRASWDKIPSSKDISSISDEVKNEYRSFISSKCGIWGVKDPRLNLFIEYLEPFLSAPVYIYCKRPELDVAQSLLVRDNMPIEHGLLLKREYDTLIESFLVGKKNVVAVEYDELTKYPEKAIRNVFTVANYKPTVTIGEIIKPVKDRSSLSTAKRKTLFQDIFISFIKVMFHPKIFSFQKIKSKLARWAREYKATMKK